ncbi:MAG: ABC transporter permease subunit [Thiohalospira sp.]|uniref:ABC transporter permease subunit n=1 Tax=Thiohalospira sp. TaxID=3080549 RepID=UPI00397E93BF
MARSRLDSTRDHWRSAKDHLARYGVAAGGISVIVALILIFFYLLWVVLPLFDSAELTAGETVPVAAPGEPAHFALEEYAEVGVRFSREGDITFFRAADGRTVKQERIDLPEGVEVTSFSAASPASRMVAWGLSNGEVIVVRPAYEVDYPDGQRRITPELEYPMGEDPITALEEGNAIQNLSLQSAESGHTIAAAGTDGHLEVSRFEVDTNFMTGEEEVERSGQTIEGMRGLIQDVRVGGDRDRLYVTHPGGALSFYELDGEQARLAEYLPQMTPDGADITSLELLSGGTSLLVGDAEGNIGQWFAVRDDDSDGHRKLREIRRFETDMDAILAIEPEQARKGFMASDAEGRIGIFHATAHQQLLQQQVAGSPVDRITIAPRANAALTRSTEGTLRFWHIDNDHPEVSMSALWSKVWYEGYDEPSFTWQSTSASDDFEPKLSLVPISFGTLKAAFYAMIVAVPLAIMGAIFTAQFMNRRMRSMVKPTIEIMEALPTVIIGFLAGLWLAPIIERHLTSVLLLFIALPPVVVLAALGWQGLPRPLRERIPDGWEAALLFPVVLIAGWLAFQVGPLLELALFKGDLPLWLTYEMGIDYDQRNSIVIGLAMGFAVIPTIFSIAEDAIFGVPRHLTNGSLAMGATPWQTLVRVVLLTASPGIFSAIMIGLGRAVGETMIVLMATGNTPVMDMSLFTGMRTLAANIAVEMPESAVGSTHYRVLFLAALVLFVFTFLVNTLAEVVRQRLRKKYSSL